MSTEDTFFCTRQLTPSAMQGGYGGSTSQGGQASAGGYAMPQGFREVGQKSYNAYQSTVYEPFTDALPSSAGSTTDEQFVITERKNGFIKPGDPNTSTESPVGEPWILLLFAAAAAIVVAWRRRKVV